MRRRQNNSARVAMTTTGVIKQLRGCLLVTLRNNMLPLTSQGFQRGLR